MDSAVLLMRGRNTLLALCAALALEAPGLGSIEWAGREPHPAAVDPGEIGRVERGAGR